MAKCFTFECKHSIKFGRRNIAAFQFGPRIVVGVHRIHRLIGLPLRRYADGNTSIPVWRTEEKATDVNLGSHLISDAFQDHFDTALVISNDSDLCEPIRLTVHDLGKKVIVVNPRGHRQQSVAIKNVASEVRNLRAAALTASQLPLVLHDEFGTIHKPDDW
ncbi:MAG: NYN domain-containing protein [Actinobacteria bacterium]|nr:NYN domain-containing protein [Actinomycetota bacterium]